MKYTTILSTQTLAQHLCDPNWLIVDCRFSLDKPERGRHDYGNGHISGAVYCHLEEDLCGRVTPDKTGRHPLPSIEKLETTFSRLGIDLETQVVAYDDWPGGPGGIAARLWWSLRYLGHEKVALLDGGWERWLSEGRPVHSGIEIRTPAEFTTRQRPELLASVEEVEQMRRNRNAKVFDARSMDRYRGDFEPIDKRAGHIPGAISAYYGENYTEEDTFLSPEELRERYLKLLGNTPPQNTAFYCGSGVTAALNLVALAHAGLGDAKLYVGAWSDWITDPQRPIATGKEP